MFPDMVARKDVGQRESDFLQPLTNAAQHVFVTFSARVASELRHVMVCRINTQTCVLTDTRYRIRGISDAGIGSGTTLIKPR